jgi:hypothetical protein
LDIRKYGSRDIVDLMADLTFSGADGCAVMSRSLKAMAARFGLGVQDETNGSDVAALIAAGDYEAVAAHCESDVQTTVALYRKLHGNRPAIVVDIETAAIDNAFEFRTFVKPDGRLSDPKKIEADIDSKLLKAPLDPFLCRIVVLGYEVVR